MADRSLSAPDPSPSAGSSDTRTRLHLAMLHSARDRGDRGEAERLWVLIVTAELERVRGLVRAFRQPVLPGGQIPAVDVDDVVQEVFLRLHDKVDTLRGRSVGELRKFMSTATGYTCLDYVDRHVREDRRRAGSLNADDGAARASTEHALAQLADQFAADDDEALIAREVVHPALALIDPDKRMVLTMDVRGVPTAEIMETLGISRDAVYQRRRRGHVQLRDAIAELAEEDDG